MRIKIESINDGCEPEIIIRCNELDESLLQLINAIKSNSKKQIGEANSTMHLIEAKDVFYFETVDDRVFIYCRDQVFETKKKLYQIEAEYENSNFFRASKSVILNIGKIKSFSPAFSGRFEAVLENGEKVIISRQYVPVLKKKLGM